CQQYTNSPCSF
nr:immunoglobulin light chain junction region [Macaca mulatta]